MERHSINFWNDIAEQIQCSVRSLTQEETAVRPSKIHWKSIKNRAKSVQNRSWKRSWGVLGPSWPQEAPRPTKCSKTQTLVPPIWGPKINQNLIKNSSWRSWGASWRQFSPRQIQDASTSSRSVPKEVSDPKTDPEIDQKSTPKAEKNGSTSILHWKCRKSKKWHPSKRF